MSLKQSLVRCLEEIKTLNQVHDARSRPSKNKAERALNLIYQTGLRQTSFTDSEREAVGALLAAAIKAIQVNIESTANVDRTRLENAVLMKRSAVQFLIDNYGNFPVGNTTLNNELQKSNISESIEILNEIIEKWRCLTDSDEGSSDREAAGATAVPRSHIWWNC